MTGKQQVRVIELLLEWAPRVDGDHAWRPPNSRLRLAQIEETTGMETNFQLV